MTSNYNDNNALAIVQLGTHNISLGNRDPSRNYLAQEPPGLLWDPKLHAGSSTLQAAVAYSAAITETSPHPGPRVAIHQLENQLRDITNVVSNMKHEEILRDQSYYANRKKNVHLHQRNAFLSYILLLEEETYR